MRSRRQAGTEDIVTYIYDKVRLLQACDIALSSPTPRQHVDKTAYMTRRTWPSCLCRQSRMTSRRPSYGRRSCRTLLVGAWPQATHRPATSRRGSFSCGCFGRVYMNCPQAQHQTIQYQKRPLPTVQVRIDGIGELTDLGDTGAHRKAVFRPQTPQSPSSIGPKHPCGGAL